jgi:hypothetical protein
MALVYVPSAAEAIKSLLSDPSRRVLAEKLKAVLRQLRDDPGHESVRRHRNTTDVLGDKPYWLVQIWDPDETWWVAWRPDGEDTLVTYAGPEPGAA